MLMQIVQINSIKILVLERLQVNAVLVVGFQGHAVPVELLRELRVLQLIPFMLRRPVFLELFEALGVEELLLELAAFEEHAFVGLDDEALLVKPGLVGDNLFELEVGLFVDLVSGLVEGVLDGTHLDALFHLNRETELL